MNIEKYGFRPQEIPDNAVSTTNTAGIPARITACHRGRFEIVCEAGCGNAHLKASVYRAGGETFPTTGDFVLLDWQRSGESRILKTLPRRTCFTRLDPSSSGHGGQAVAANFDYVFVMQSLDGGYNPRRLERYLTLAWQSGAVPVVLLSKADCVADHSAQLRAAERLAVGAEAFAINCRSGYGMDRLDDYLKPGKTVVFLGSSGVGKSSLVNALAGEEIMATRTVRDKDGWGRHTTTHSSL